MSGWRGPGRDSHDKGSSHHDQFVVGAAGALPFPPPRAVSLSVAGSGVPEVRARATAIPMADMYAIDEDSAGLSRRRFLGVAGGATVSLAVSACAGSGSRTSVTQTLAAVKTI